MGVKRAFVVAGVASAVLGFTALTVGPAYAAPFDGTCDPGERCITDVDNSDLALFAAPDTGPTAVDELIDFGNPIDPAPSIVAGPTSSSTAAEEAWVDGLVGDVDPILEQTTGGGIGGSLGGTFAGPAGWVYALVKPDNFYVLYQNTVGGDNLVTDLFSMAISHASFYTPLPAAAWLLLSALAGLFGVRWWKGRGAEAMAA